MKQLFSFHCVCPIASSGLTLPGDPTIKGLLGAWNQIADMSVHASTFANEVEVP